jgi:hypothetical protein
MNLGRLVAGLVCLLMTAGTTHSALADPVNGHNSTPGTLVCPGFSELVDSTSGSGAASAVQLVSTTHVLVVKQVALLDGTVLLSRANMPATNLTVCTLNEPSIGVPVLIKRILTPAH